MASLARGQKVKLTDLTSTRGLTIGIGAVAPGLSFDISCFGVDSADQLSDDRYFVFFNQKASPEGAIQQTGASGSDTETFQVDLAKLPAAIRKLVFVLTIDGPGDLSKLQNGYVRVLAGGNEVARFAFSGSDFTTEKAIIAAEIYQKDVWRLAAVGQGFAGGLSALLKHFGGQEAEGTSQPTAPATAATATAPTTNPATSPAVAPISPSPTAPASPAPASSTPSVNLKKIQLEKKMEQKAPHLLSLAKTAQVSLEKQGLGQHAARVALCLDISASMSSLYSSGKIQRFAEKVLALGTRFDDDGAIDIFLFGANAHDAGEMTVDNFGGFVGNILQSYRLEAGTYYGKAIRMIRRHYFESDGARNSPISDRLPVYVMFLTDGQTADSEETKRQLQYAAYEPIFWQFMGIGKSRKDVQASRGGFLANLMATSFEFLESLDNMAGRYVDNANFFSVSDPELLPDAELYDLLMAEYPTWVREAPSKGLLR